MEYVYGRSLTVRIVRDVVITMDTHDDRMSEYDRGNGKIEIASNHITTARTSLAIVHESAHWVQDKVLHRKYGWGFAQPPERYTFVIAKLNSQQGLEAEAEIARTLGLWYIQSKDFLIYVRGPVVFLTESKRIFATDCYDNRMALWGYMTSYLHVAPPYNWDDGL